jgi:uncharacterized protein (TIGR02231 family)
MNNIRTASSALASPGLAARVYEDGMIVAHRRITPRRSVKKVVTWIVLLPFVATSLNAKPIIAEAKISDVTVYADRAQVTRTGEVSLPPGESRVLFEGLPATLVDESVRVKGQSTAPVTIEDVEVRTIVGEQTSDTTAKELEDRLQRLHDENAALDARQRVLDQRRSFLQQFQNREAGIVSPGPQINKIDIVQVKNVMNFLADEYAKLEDETGKIAVERRDLQPKISAVEAEFNKHRAADARTSKTVLVTVTAKEPATLRLQASYVLGGASWQPLYDARAAVQEGKVELIYNAIVRQQTGEDWRGVNLTLSTAQPAIGAQMPELGIWILNFAGAVMMTDGMVNFGGNASVLAGGPRTYTATAFAPSGPVFPMSVESQVAQVEQAVTSATFRVPRAADVPSDAEPHRQTIAEESLPASFCYETTPKLSSLAYLKATATNSTDAPFLAGAVNAFVGPDLIGAGHIDTTASGEAVTLFLGTDDAIRVKREELKDRRGKSGLFKNRQTQVYGYKITVENYKDKPQLVRVCDQIPVSVNEDIKVALGEPSVKPSENDVAKGRLTWDLQLLPREKREIVYEFTIDWPQGKQIAGL